jgi:hypothetical protein
MNFIFMLTHGDKTVENCLDVLDEVLPLGLGHIGFKDIGVPGEVLRELNRRIRAAGVTSYMEVVSETPEACLRSAHVAVELGVERLLGGTDMAAITPVLEGSDIAYYPFPGFPVEHPTKLRGKPEDIAAHCRDFMAKGAAGVDLLAYRATDADPIDLVRQRRAAYGPSRCRRRRLYHRHGRVRRQLPSRTRRSCPTDPGRARLPGLGSIDTQVAGFGMGEIGLLLGATTKDMPGIFEEERRGSSPISPYPGGTGRFWARPSSRKACGEATPRRLPLLALAQNRSRQNRNLNVDWPWLFTGPHP